MSLGLVYRSLTIVDDSLLSLIQSRISIIILSFHHGPDVGYFAC
jgi:hypothetical protein